jgi:hypothetical protein
MTSETSSAIHAPAPVHPRSRLRSLKTSLLVLALIAGIGAITMTAAAKAITDEGGGMAGYA